MCQTPNHVSLLWAEAMVFALVPCPSCWVSLWIPGVSTAQVHFRCRPRILYTDLGAVLLWCPLLRDFFPDSSHSDIPQTGSLLLQARMTVASVWVPDPSLCGINRELLSTNKPYRSGSYSVTVLPPFKSQTSLRLFSVADNRLKKHFETHVVPRVVGVSISQTVSHLALLGALPGRCWRRRGAAENTGGWSSCF